MRLNDILAFRRGSDIERMLEFSSYRFYSTRWTRKRRSGNERLCGRLKLNAYNKLHPRVEYIVHPCYLEKIIAINLTARSFGVLVFVFFLRRGGATGTPGIATSSIDFPLFFVLAITSGS